MDKIIEKLKIDFPIEDGWFIDIIETNKDKSIIMFEESVITINHINREYEFNISFNLSITQLELFFLVTRIQEWLITTSKSRKRIHFYLLNDEPHCYNGNGDIMFGDEAIEYYENKIKSDSLKLKFI